ncbi:MAG: protein translocase subunit SecF [bacterium]|nr:protein translocase subunit SecF [bacterium]
MKVFSNKLNIDFMKLRTAAIAMSLALIALSIFTWFNAGASKYGVDFAGGNEIVLRFATKQNMNDLRKALDANGFTSAVVQEFVDEGSALGIGEESGDHDISVKLKATEKGDVAKGLETALRSSLKEDFSIVKEDYVGPVVGEQIRSQGLTALACSLLVILAYVSFRFEFRFAVGAVVALAHDVIITTGIFLLSGHELSTGALAALLTIVGYSINDTIIVFDRIRENMFSKGKKKLALVDVINNSVNQTMSRTVLTSGTTLFVTTSLWLFGGGGIADLSYTLTIGILIGTYSSIFIASPVLLLWKKD